MPNCELCQKSVKRRVHLQKQIDSLRNKLSRSGTNTTDFKDQAKLSASQKLLHDFFKYEDRMMCSQCKNGIVSAMPRVPTAKPNIRTQTRFPKAPQACNKCLQEGNATYSTISKALRKSKSPVQVSKDHILRLLKECHVCSMQSCTNNPNSLKCKNIQQTEGKLLSLKHKFK